MSNPRVYLAGPISGLTYDQTTNWRDQAASLLTAANIDCFSPMRAKDYLRREGKIDGSYETHPTATARAIMTRDRFDVGSCDLVLMNLVGAKRVSIGTMVEVGWADAWRKPIVLAIEPENIHNHPMLAEAAGFQAPTLEEALDIVLAILLP